MNPQQTSHTNDLPGRVAGIFLGYCKAMLLAGLIFGILGTIIGTYFCGMWGFLLGPVCGVLYLIPFFGAPVAVGLMAIGAFLCAGGFSGVDVGSAGKTALVAASALLGVNISLDYVITPRLIGKGVGLRPLVALACTLLGGMLFGIWGLILAVPVVGSLNVILSSTSVESTTNGKERTSENEPLSSP